MRKELLHGKKGGLDVFGVSGAVGAAVERPIFGREIPVQVFAAFADVDGKIRPDPGFPGEELQKLIPDGAVQHGVGVGDLVPPEPLRYIGGDPVKFVAAAGKFPLRGAGDPVVPVGGRGDLREAAVLIQKGNAHPVGEEKFLRPGEGNEA